MRLEPYEAFPPDCRLANPEKCLLKNENVNFASFVFGLIYFRRRGHEQLGAHYIPFHCGRDKAR